MPGTMTIRELITQWGFQVDDSQLEAAEKKLARTRAQADKAGDSLTSAFERPRDAMGKFTKFKFGQGGGGFLPGWADSIDMIGDAAEKAKRSLLGMTLAFTAGSFGLGGFFKMIGGFEQTEIAFDTLIGDAVLAKKTLADLQQFAANTPFNFGETAELSKRLLAYRFQAEELIPVMTALGNVAAGVGKEKLPQLVLALGQVKSAGVLKGSELRQFTETGIPLIHELAKNMGIAQSQVADFVSQGKVGFKDVYHALETLTGAGGMFNNLMEKQSQSLLGRFAAVTDKLQLMAVEIGKRGLLGKAKAFLEGFLDILTAHREEILGGIQHAIELTVLGLERIGGIFKNVWYVVRGFTNTLGGTRRTLELFIKGWALFTTGKMVMLLGQATVGVMGMGKAWLFAGNAARMAKFEMIAIPLAIGAAVIGLALIIEDVVAYFQGRKSITGMLMGNLDNLGDKFEQFLGPVMEKVKKFGAQIGRAIIDGISALSQADWETIGNTFMKALEVLAIASTIPLRIGIAIADGIIQGLTQGLREKFPAVAKFLDLDEKPSMMPAPGSSPFAPAPLGIGEGALELFRLLRGVTSGAPGVPSPAGITSPSALSPGGNASVMVDMPVTVTVPPGTPSDQVIPAVERGMSKGIDRMVRDLRRKNKSLTDY